MKLFIGNLSISTNAGDIESLFSEVGELVSVKVITDRDTGRSRGFAFVEYETKSEGSSAISRFNGYTMDGYQLKVNEAQERQDRSKLPRW